MGQAKAQGWELQLSDGTPLDEKESIGVEEGLPGSPHRMEAGDGKNQEAGSTPTAIRADPAQSVAILAQAILAQVCNRCARGCHHSGGVLPLGAV